MKKYLVQVDYYILNTETVEVDAESAEDAQQIAEDSVDYDELVASGVLEIGD